MEKLKEKCNKLEVAWNILSDEETALKQLISMAQEQLNVLSPKVKRARTIYENASRELRATTIS